MVDEQEENREIRSARTFFQDREHWFLMGISGLLPLLSFGVLWYSIGNREATIVLHYNVYFGIDILGEWWQAYLIPFVGVGIWCLHVLLAVRFFSVGNRALCKITLATLFFLEGMIFVASIAVSLVNY